MEFVRLEPVLVPLAMLVMDGFGTWTATLKGLATAIVVGQVLQVKRWNGQPAVKWFYVISNQ
ncbi:hypothetical protein HDV02_006684, partial [Globomyces sp. JEL0801]